MQFPSRRISGLWLLGSTGMEPVSEICILRRQHLGLQLK